MRFIKRIGVFLIATVVFLSSIPSYAYEFNSYSEDNYTAFSQRQQLFVNLGVLDKAKDSQDIVTRAEFAHLLVKLFELDGLGVDSSNVSFTDIGSEEYAKDIECVYASEIMTSMDSTLFYPNDPIMVKDMARALVCALGYGYTATSKYGDKDDSYVPMARELKLFKGTEIKEDVYAVTYIELLQILENSLDVNFLKASTKTGGTLYYEVSDNNLMNSVFKCEKRTGIVTATSLADLYGNAEVSDGYVKIDGIKYKCSAEAEDLIGYRVNYYYNEDDDTILYLCKDLERNIELVVEGKDIDSYSSRKYTYSNSRGTTKHIDLPVGCAVLYNGRADSTSSSSFSMIPTNGTVKFIDNNGDGNYEVVLIEDYISIVVGTIDALTQTIYDKFDNTIKCTINGIEEKFVTVTSSEGKDTTFKGIKTGNVVSIAQSADGTRTKMIISPKKIEGVIRQIDEDNVIIDEEKYEKAGDIRNITAIKAGKKVTAYIDYNDRVVYIEQKSEVVEAAYLIDAKINKRTEILKLKFCNSSGTVEDVECSEKLYVNDVKQTSHSAALTELCDLTGAVEPQIFTMLRDADGKIKRIYKVWTGAKSNCPPEALMLNSTVTDTSHKYMTSSGMFLDFKTALSSSCKIFFLPTPLTNTDEFAVLSVSDLGNDKAYGDTTDSLKTYVLGKDGFLCNYAVAAVKYSPKRSNTYGIIKKITHIYDEEKEEACVDVEIATGSVVRIYSNTGINVNSISPYKVDPTNTYSTYSMTPGDLINYYYNVKDGKVLMTSVTMIYDYETKDYLASNPSNLSKDASVFYLADVWKKAPGYLALSVNGKNSQYTGSKVISPTFDISAPNYRIENIATASIFRADGSGKNVVRADFADIVDYNTSKTQYSQIIIWGKQGKATCCYIIN